jgi:hypothetical protein
LKCGKEEFSTNNVTRVNKCKNDKKIKEEEKKKIQSLPFSAFKSGN